MEIQESSIIRDVKTVQFSMHGDDRGRFHEVFRKTWFPQRTWENMQMNRSDSKAGVLRGLHFHYHQVDYWYVLKGVIRAGLADLRPNSPTYMQQQVIEMGETNPIGLFIPIGVAHGFYTVKDCTLMYVVDNYYDNSDEHGVAWNDPTLKVAWHADSPILSGRDMANPAFNELDLSGYAHL